MSTKKEQTQEDAFVLKEDLRQGHWIAFRKAMWSRKARLQEEWGVDELTELPADVFYHYMVECALDANWAETNLTLDSLQFLPIPNKTGEWGKAVFDRYVEAISPDPNS